MESQESVYFSDRIYLMERDTLIKIIRSMEEIIRKIDTNSYCDECQICTHRKNGPFEHGPGECEDCWVINEDGDDMWDFDYKVFKNPEDD